MKLRLGLLLVFVCGLSACASPTPTATPIPPTATMVPSPTAVPSTPTPYPTYTPLATYTPVPTATRIPSTSTPTPTAILRVELYAFCNCLQDVDVSAPLVLAWNWEATTADLVKDFVSASQITVWIDGKSYTNLERFWGDPRLDATTNRYSADWGTALPTLAEGKHRIETRVTLSRAVTDGFDENKDGKPDQYGPGEAVNGWIEITLIPGLAKGSVLAGPTRMPTPSPTSQFPAIPAGMGGLVVVNWYGQEMNLQIGGKPYKVPASGGQVIIYLPPGRQNYSANIPRRWSSQWHGGYCRREIYVSAICRPIVSEPIPGCLMHQPHSLNCRNVREHAENA